MTSTATNTTQPLVGHSFGPRRIRIDSGLVSAYVASTGDDAFWAHRTAMTRHFGGVICPPTLFDRDVGTRLAQERYAVTYALHAKQEFRFLQPLIEGEEYVIEGQLSRIYERNSIKYFTITASVRGVDGEERLISNYTRAYEFPGARHPSKTSEPLTLRRFLDEALPGDQPFPAAGSVTVGTPRRLGQDAMNLYSGPSSNIHTDRLAASIRGHAVPIAQGLMATSIECGLYREMFGERWYTSGQFETRFIRPIRSGSEVTPWAIVESVGDGVMRLRSGVFNQDGLALTVSTASVAFDQRTTGEQP